MKIIDRYIFGQSSKCSTLNLNLEFSLSFVEAQAYTANVYTQMTDKLLFLYAINTHENM
jgi:hypothetical protein